MGRAGSADAEVSVSATVRPIHLRGEFRGRAGLPRKLGPSTPLRYGRDDDQEEAARVGFSEITADSDFRPSQNSARICSLGAESIANYLAEGA